MSPKTFYVLIFLGLTASALYAFDYRARDVLLAQDVKLHDISPKRALRFAREIVTAAAEKGNFPRERDENIFSAQGIIDERGLHQAIFAKTFGRNAPGYLFLTGFKLELSPLTSVSDYRDNYFRNVRFNIFSYSPGSDFAKLQGLNSQVLAVEKIPCTGDVPRYEGDQFRLIFSNGESCIVIPAKVLEIRG